jgi:phage tail sheath protein FI
MAFYMSPGVYVQERDLSTIVPAVSTTIGALVGYSAKGSLDITLVTNRQQFIEEYGEPVAGNYFHYTALAFLEHGTQLYCRRVINGSLYPGMSVVLSGSGEDNQAFTVGQSSPVFYDESGLTDELFSIFAKDPGLWGNSLSCVIKNVLDDTEPEVTDQYTFEIDVYLTDAEGTTSQVENWKVSRRTKVDGYGKQLYLETRINDYSAYIVVADNTGVADTVVPKENATAVTLAGGTDGSTVTPSDIIGVESSATGWYGFYNYDEIDVRILLGGGFISTFTPSELAQIQTAMVTIAEFRKDCIAVLDVPYSEAATVADTVTYRDTTLNANTSYAALYAPWVKINDAYNDIVVEVPPSGYAGAQMAYTDHVADTWWAPAGFNRGILNVLSTQLVYTEGDRNTLYPAEINPIQIFRGEGIAIWGQRTLQSKRSALSGVNVRRLLIALEKALAISLRSFVFEPNNDITRFRITGMVTEYLDRLSSQGAFQTELGDEGFAVICDETNNTPAVIDANELHVDVFVKPVRSSEFIRLQTIITTTGTSFEELISRGVLL